MRVHGAPYYDQSIKLLRIEKRYFKKEGKTPGQTSSFSGQHVQFEENSKFSRMYEPCRK